MESNVNMMMVEYEENVNLIAKINAELCKTLGLENYLTEFSSNLIRALNQYKRFVSLLKEKEKFVNKIIKFSNSCIEFFKINLNNKESNKNSVKSMNNVLSSLNDINEMINNSFYDSVKDLL